MQQPDALQAGNVLKIQTILSLVSVLLALPFGRSVALSVLIGSGSCLLANAMLAAWVFRAYRAQAPERLVRRFYRAEVAKIALVLGLFVVAFATFDDLNIPALLGAYLLMQVMPILIAAQQAKRNTK
ncbi:ATP synthase I [Marichromatium purpuratum 984]|uniref:ATP synthase I n=1 Tax=Marichromatium purpuratum 984 TaxID=765910 RepID=W0DZ09_MARPU|nr:ATP synthase subunit I [Marichromatium purpuratum]AHF02523.1 ATP synthase I [Marichromatium purpuratum 984]